MLDTVAPGPRECRARIPLFACAGLSFQASRRLGVVRIVGRELGEPEIEQLDRAVLGDNRVGWFDIAVEHAPPVGRRKTAREVERVHVPEAQQVPEAGAGQAPGLVVSSSG